MQLTGTMLIATFDADTGKDAGYIFHSDLVAIRELGEHVFGP